ncbi:hypothetical protein [Streptacidiphilus anmyonensis]|uniref:hypothetical protein n=1 Tax=Streptacidiphilus anmyonensis TaxID=405782 RepID=UPI0005AA8056|nr:hypothetical protein [Streptacidiphilus anmyonensis]
METTTEETATQEAFRAVLRCLRLYAGLSALGLLAVVAAAVAGHAPNTFMWVRAALLPVVAVLLHRAAVAASGGSRRSFERIRGLAAVMPVAIVGVDLIPGVCPPWYTVVQCACMVPVLRAALLARTPALCAAFPRAQRWKPQR